MLKKYVYYNYLVNQVEYFTPTEMVTPSDSPVGFFYGVNPVKQQRPGQKTHGLIKHPIYKLWSGMIQRCTNKKMKQYRWYGGRGVSVYNPWRDFELFYEWCNDNGWSRGLELDRIDNDGNYEPSNCRFVTHKENMRNTRANKIIVYNGEKHCIAEWADILGLSFSVLQSRIYRGWDTKRAFTTPVSQTSKYAGINYSKSKKKWIARCGEGYKTHIGTYDTEQEAYLQQQNYIKREAVGGE